MRTLTIIAGATSILCGMILGVSVAVLYPGPTPPPQKLKTNMELLGDFRTVVDPNDPLVKQLKLDDELRARAEREE